MKKPIDLRKYLEDHVPSLKKHPDKLHVFVEKGSVATKAGKGMSFEYHYTLKLVIIDFPEPADAVIVPLLAWIATNQPDLILDTDKRDKAIDIEAEIIDHKTVDLGLDLRLSERVIVTATEAGWAAEHVGEPQLEDLSGPLDWDINPEA